MVVGSFAHKGGQNYHYGLMVSRSPVIIQDARPEIGDTPLTFISLMGQLACRLPFHIESWSLTPLLIAVTMEPIDCQNNQTKIGDTTLLLSLDLVHNHFA